MKRIFTYIVLAALTALAFGCKKDDDADRKDLDSRQRVPISVTYSVDGAQVTALSFTHGAMQKTIDVTVNNENLHWNLESNRPWCKVVQTEHVGSGSVTLEIEANEGFEARDPATLTFTAGEYQSASLTVNQNGSAFIISHPYLLSSKEEGTLEVTVKTVEGTLWAIESGAEWIETEIGDADTEDGMSVTTLRLKPMANDGDSRYGTVTLATDNDNDSIALYQFGQDFDYDGDGYIFFPSDEPASISFTAPTYVVKEVVKPAYATVSNVDAGSGRVTWTVAFEDNFSDCELIREIPVSIILNNAAMTSIELPAMRQDFTAAGGLMTAVGLKAFAAKVAEGGDISSWQTDGVVRVLQDIDMDGVDDWAGVGTAEHPFAGVFDGQDHSIVNLREAEFPLFNVCDGATVKNITIARNCDFYVGSSGGQLLAGFANKAIGSTFDHCVFAGTVGYATKVADSCVGAIVADADAATIVKSCKMNGTIKVTTSTTPTDGLTIYIGGIAANSKGTVSNCEMSGSISITSGHATANIGGITAVLNESTTVSGNSFTGTIDLGGTGTGINAGALYGYLPSGSRTFDFATDKSSPVGSINLNKYGANTSTRIYLGGFIGLIGEGVSLSVKGFEVQTNFTIDYTEGLNANYICAGGVLGSCEPDALAGNLTFDSVTNYGTFTFKYAAKAVPVTRNCMGGIAGLVNGDANFTDCVNKAILGIKGGANDYPNNSNSYTMILGGIAGHCYGAPMSFTRCENQADLTNNFYSNRPAENANGNYYASIASGGIIGAFNYKPNPQDKTLTVTNCRSTGKLVALRGYLGGIVGYAYQAQISDCEWNGSSVGVTVGNDGFKLDNLASYKGGIAGGLGNATVTNCTAKGNIDAFRYGSAASAEPGGIVGHVMYKANDESSPFNKAVKVSNCSYFGNLYWEAKADPKLGYPGGIVALGGANTEVKDCRFGGKIMTTEIDSHNVTSLAVGNYEDCGCTVENISLWNGI